MTEGELFSGVVDWCVANAGCERESKEIFQKNFENKFIVSNISIDMFQRSIRAKSHFLSDKLFRDWTYEVLEKKVATGTRFALIMFKVHSTEIKQRHFLDPVKTDDGRDFNIWRGEDEFPEVLIDLKIYQKVSDGVHAPLGKFGILLQTTHTCKDGFDLSSITERVSIKMVARKEDGSVVKKTFKPVEDSCSSLSETNDLVRKNTFVLSKNRDERLTWKTMEVVAILDRRAKCNINAITQEKFAEISASGLVQNYLQYATKFSFDVNMTLDQALRKICEGLKVKNMCGESAVSQFCYWHYIFTKGFVGILRSSRATPGETWTATTVSDYLRCKVINHPIGVDNAALRRSAFKTWIIAEKEVEEEVGAANRKEKRMFVCTYNPNNQTVTFAKKFTMSVEAKTETLGKSKTKLCKRFTRTL